MKQETMYDVKKRQNELYKKIYKTSKKVIKLQKNDILMERVPNYIASGIALTGGLCVAGYNFLNNSTNDYICAIAYSLLYICSIIPLINNDTERKEKLEELKDQEKKLNKLIKEQKITKEETKELKKYKVNRF